MLTRPSVDLFINAYGLYDDVWAAYAEGIINLSITLLFGYKYGLIGILLGKIISMFFLVILWKPYYLYHRGFKESITPYCKNVIIHITIIVIIIQLNNYANHLLGWQVETNIIGIVKYALCITFPFVIIYTILVYLFCSGAKDIVQRIPLLRKK